MRIHLKTSDNKKSTQQKASGQVTLTPIGRQALTVEHPLLRMQRLYGNRYVQRVIDLAHRVGGDAEPGAEVPSLQRKGGAPASHRFVAEGVNVVVRPSCAPVVFGFANVETATSAALNAIFNTDCIEESRRRRIQRNLTAHGLDIRCRRSANLGGACAEATAGFYTPANFFTVGSKSFVGHPDSRAGCQPLESTILHEIVHLTRGVAQDALPSSCEASCFSVGAGNPELCRDIDVFGRRREP